jgi:hypothetical protein
MSRGTCKGPNHYVKRWLTDLTPSRRPNIRNFKVARQYKQSKKYNLVLSTSLFGDPNTETFNSRYLSPLLESIRKIKDMDNVVYRIYVPIDMQQDIIDQLISCGAEVYVIDHIAIDFEFTLTRFLCVRDSPEVHSMSVDADDVVEDVLIQQLREWQLSKKSFFVKKHSGWRFVSLTAGRIGFAPFAVEDMESRIAKYNELSFGIDEQFLKAEILPLTDSKNTYYTCTYSGHEFIYDLALVLLYLFPMILFSLLVTGVVVKERNTEI